MYVKKFLVYLIFAAVLSALGYELYELNQESVKTEKKFINLNSEKELLLKDSEKLKQNIDYFKEPHNLEKELRARFNIRRPDEKLITIVPPSQEIGE